MTLTGGTNPNRHAVADAVRIARVAQAGGASIGPAGVDPLYDPLEDTLDDLASEWADTPEYEESHICGERFEPNWQLIGFMAEQ